MFGLGNSSPKFTVARSITFTQDANESAAVNIDNSSDSILKKRTEAVHVSLAKKNLAGIRAQVVLVLDHSGSMYGDYREGKVQDLVERFLAFALNVDMDGTIPVMPFDDRVKPTIDVDLSNYSGVVQRSIYQPNDMGSTNLTAALKEIENMASSTTDPLFVAIVTDGEPNDRHSAQEVVCNLSRYPVFIKFLAVRKVDFLEKLDDLDNNQRLLDNVDTKEYLNLSSISDSQFADDMVDEWDSWTAAAKTAGILV